jgi:hypothetical protein
MGAKGEALAKQFEGKAQEAAIDEHCASIRAAVGR